MKLAALAAVLVGLFAYVWMNFGITAAGIATVVGAGLIVASGIGKVNLGELSVESRVAKPNQGAPRRRKGREANLIAHPPGVTTLYENFQSGLKKARDSPCLAYRPNSNGGFVAETYAQVSTRIRNFGSGLLHLGITPGEHVGFYAKNRREWVIGAESCNTYSLVSVAIYDTLGEEHRAFIVDQSELAAIVTTPNLLKNIAALKSDPEFPCGHLRLAISMDDVTDEQRNLLADVGVKLYTFAEIEELGAKNPRDPIPPKPEDLAIIMYTSGTTSRPKGVMISHANCVAVIQGVIDSIPAYGVGDRYLSYLPLAHILERAAEASMFCQGAAIGFYQGDIRKLSDDIVTWKPTIYCGVPKVFLRIMNTVKMELSKSPAPIRWLFNTAIKLKLFLRQYGLSAGFLDKTLFKKVRAALGGQTKVIVSGGAPLGAECHQFLSACFGLTIQGYGLTETCGGVALSPLNLPDTWEKAGTPLCCCEVKLVSHGKYNSRGKPPQGEICIRGPNVTMGYYKNPEKTAEVFVKEADGEVWFHTGDVGQWNKDGTLSIIGRVKDIFKLDGGEYIAPERLETIFGQSKFLSNTFVYGESSRSYIVAVVVPECGFAKNWAKLNGVNYNADAVRDPDVAKEICQNPKFKEAILADFKTIAEKAKLNAYEIPTKIYVDGHFWTPDSGLVTDAMKNKRDPLYERYQDQITELYNS